MNNKAQSIEFYLLVKISLSILFFMIMPASYSDYLPTYTIEKSINDDTFIINDHVYKAQTYCFNVEDGDSVMFIDGSAFGACASAKFLDMRTNDTCSVWCE